MLKKPKKFIERVIYFLRDIPGILDRFRYSRSFEPVNYNFLVSFQMVIQIYNPFSMQGFITERRRETFTSGGVMPFLSCFETSFAIQVLYFSETYAFAAFLTLRSSGWNLIVTLCDMITISQYFWSEVLSNHRCPTSFNVSIISSDVCSFGYAIFSLIWSQYGKIAFPKCAVAFN